MGLRLPGGDRARGIGVFKMFGNSDITMWLLMAPGHRLPSAVPSCPMAAASPAGSGGVCACAPCPQPLLGSRGSDPIFPHGLYLCFVINSAVSPQGSCAHGSQALEGDTCGGEDGAQLPAGARGRSSARGTISSCTQGAP